MVSHTDLANNKQTEEKKGKGLKEWDVLTR
jgi:hypothetical protein